MNRKDIQHILRSYFLSLVLIVLGLLAILFSIMQYRSYRSTALESMQRACRATASGIQANLTQMDSVVLNAISSDLTDLIDHFSDPDESNLEHFQVRKQITSLLLSQKGFDYTIRQLSIYSELGAGYGLGAGRKNPGRARPEPDGDLRRRQRHGNVCEKRRSGRKDQLSEGQMTGT